MPSHRRAFLPTAIGLSLVLPGPADAHAPSVCVFPVRPGPIGSVHSVYRLPHGCIQLDLPTDETRLPIIVIRKHNADGRIVNRRFLPPTSNLDRANGSVGICGHDTTLFLVRYPFITLIAQQLYDEGGKITCDGTYAHALFWTLQLSGPSGLDATWFIHQP